MEKSNQSNKHLNEAKQQDNFQTNSTQYKDDKKRLETFSKIKTLHQNNLFINCGNDKKVFEGNLCKFSTKHHKIFYYATFVGNNLHTAKTLDNKNIFVTNFVKSVNQFNIRTNKLIKRYKYTEDSYENLILVTHDNQFLFTIDTKNKLVKLSISTLQVLDDYLLDIPTVIFFLCTYDSKFLIIGRGGFLSIFNIQKNEIIASVKVLQKNIMKAVLSKDNEKVYCADYLGNVAVFCMVTFELIETFPKIAGKWIKGMSCFNNNNYLLVIFQEGLIVFDLTIREIIKKVSGLGLEKSFVNGEESAFLFSNPKGSLQVFDLKTLEIVQDFDGYDVTKSKNVNDLVVI